MSIENIVTKIHVRFLKNKQEIDMACNLLYTVYIDELKWNFGEDTPIKIRVHCSSDGSKMLVDDHQYVAKWIGAFLEDHIIGCLRILPRLGREQFLETQHYQMNNVELNEVLNREPDLVEINRAAVYKDYRGSAIVLLEMFELLISHAGENYLSVFFTTAKPSLIGLFKKLEFTIIPEISFKYEEQDPDPVTVFLASVENHKFSNILENIRLHLNTRFQFSTKL